MTAWICVTCGVQYADKGDPDDTAGPPTHCPICEDERQYVGWVGQQWTSPAELAGGHNNDVREEEPDLVGIGTTPSFGIGQRALLVRTPAGNVLWDCISLLDDDTIAAVAALGGIDVICASHPHFYGSCVDWADTFDARVLLPTADSEWIQRPSPRVELWSEDSIEPLPGLTLARIGGHFAGAAVLHWPAGADGRGALLTGDTITVVQDRRWVSFMWSYPNLIPLDARTVGQIAARVAPLAFDRVYGGWWGRVVIEDGAAAVARSAERYIARLGLRDDEQHLPDVP